MKLIKKFRGNVREKRKSNNYFWKCFFSIRDKSSKWTSKMFDILFMLSKSEKLKIRELNPKNENIENKDKYYYFGEFGYFNLEILGGLSHYFKVYPGKKLSIVTYENYGKILELLFPKNAKTYYVDYNFDEIYRSCHDYHDRKFRVAIKKSGFKKNLAENLTSIAPELVNVRKNNPYANFIHLINSLKYPLEKSSGKKIISIFPRCRKLGTNRNLSEKRWGEIIKLLLEFNYNIVVHGNNMEFIKLNTKGLIYPRNVYEQIAYFNKSLLYVTPASGLVHFAQNCKCNTFVILNPEDFEDYKKYKDFNPFDTKVYVSRIDKDYLSKLKIVLKELERK